MPTHLQVTVPCADNNMILSSRNSPRLSLRRAASYNSMDKGPSSSTSARFSFNHLMVSPPSSPGLPPPTPRLGKQRLSPTRHNLTRGFLWLIGVLVILFYAFSRLQSDQPVHPVGWEAHDADQYEMVGESELPNFPTPLVITDKRGRSKWVVSIPPNHPFPLQPKEYADICSQNMVVSRHVADLHKHKHIEHKAHFGYYHVDGNFMDVAEAEAHGILPGVQGKTSMAAKEGSVIGEQTDSLIESDVCGKTMTYVLETSDAGLGNTLMMLWTAYGLAKSEGRHFFIDDSRWPYGKYLQFFQPPPAPNCRPPPRHQMLPCPHHARHLVVSAATANQVFGGAFNDNFEDARKMEVYRQKPVFDFARTGYEALFHLNNDDAAYVSQRVKDLRSKTVVSPSEKENGTIIGIHVRHGDRRPYEFQYRGSYVPLDRYSDKARELLTRKFNASGPLGGENMAAEMHSLMVVASDDPDVYDSEEFSHASRAQEQIRLASKKVIGSPRTDSRPSGTAGRKFVEEAVGWEGGFFAAMFWSLGRPTSIPATAVEAPTTNLPPTEEALRLRELVGRAYLMDLAVLGDVSDTIICTVSSMGCRLLAVMLGWDAAIVNNKFVNIDGQFDWRGISW